MTKFYKIFLLAIIAMGVNFAANAQLRYKADYRMLIDNLEGSQPYVATRTVAGMSLTPLVGVQFGNHSFMAGAHLLAEFGTKMDLDKAEIRAYYEFKNKNFKALAGIFSTYETEPYSLANFCTATRFLNDAIHGAYGKYKTDKGFIEGWIDWYKSDRANEVDRFLVMFQGERWWKGVRLKGFLSYNHLADKPAFETFTVFDHFQYELNLGYDFARHQKTFSALRLTAGAIGDADQARNDAKKGLEFSLGFQTEQLIQWKGFALHNTFYVGQPQSHYYQQYKFVYPGLPFYQDEWMDMLIAKYTYNYKWLQVSACLAFFFTPETVANQQILQVTFKLDDVVKFKKRDKR